jgi:hypothetical protein
LLRAGSAGYTEAGHRSARYVRSGPSYRHTEDQGAEFSLIAVRLRELRTPAVFHDC